MNTTFNFASEIEYLSDDLLQELHSSLDNALNILVLDRAAFAMMDHSAGGSYLSSLMDMFSQCSMEIFARGLYN